MYEHQLEEFVEMVNDPALARGRVYLGARVSWNGACRYCQRADGRRELVDAPEVHNEIVFRKVLEDGSVKEASVTCTHTIIFSGTLSELDAVAPADEDLAARPVEAVGGRYADTHLPPEEHFFALKSYVHGIVDMGLVNVMAASYHSPELNPETLPFGFNAAMHQQIARCLARVCPREAYYILSNLWEELEDSVPAEWLRPRVEYIRRMYGFSELQKLVTVGNVEERNAAIRAVYGRDAPAVINIWNVELFSEVDDSGEVIERNIVMGIPPRVPGNPVSDPEGPAGWLVRCERWEVYLPAPVPGPGREWWSEFPAKWRAKLAHLAVLGRETMLRAVRAVLLKQGSPSTFYKSLLSQLILWISDPSPLYSMPFSSRQVDAVLRPARGWFDGRER